MPLDVCKRIVDEVAWFKPVIRVPWMEPLLYKDLFRAIEYIKGKDLDFSMLTNGLRHYFYETADGLIYEPLAAPPDLSGR